MPIPFIKGALLLCALVPPSTDIASPVYNYPNAVSIATGNSIVQIEIMVLSSDLLAFLSEGPTFKLRTAVKTVIALRGNRLTALRTANTWYLFVTMWTLHVQPIIKFLPDVASILIFNPSKRCCQSLNLSRGPPRVTSGALLLRMILTAACR